MNTGVFGPRMMRELKMLEQDPPHGISAWPKNEKTNSLEASILGPEGTPYQGGTFQLDIAIPDRYPFEPPNVRFITPVYHPNIDSGGRICLDTLVMPPKGVWTPSLNISTVLTSIQSLLAEPNPDDGLVAEITSEYKSNKAQFLLSAAAWTRTHAMKNSINKNTLAHTTNENKRKAEEEKVESEKEKKLKVSEEVKKEKPMERKMEKEKLKSEPPKQMEKKQSQEIKSTKEESDDEIIICSSEEEVTIVKGRGKGPQRSLQLEKKPTESKNQSLLKKVEEDDSEDEFSLSDD